MSPRVYFVQPKDGGPVRVGATQQVPSRVVQISSWHPHGVEIIGSIPGYFAREAMVHQLLRPARLQRDWFRACPLLWSFLLDVVHTGLPWLPLEPTKDEWKIIGVSIRARIDAVFASRLDLAQAAEVGVPSISAGLSQGPRPSIHLYAAVVLRELRLAGKLPSYLTPQEAVPC